MALSEFWLNQAVEFVRKLKQDCDRCPDCGAVACGKRHANWHEQVQNRLDTAQTAIQGLRTRMTAAENRLTQAEDRLTALENVPPLT